MNDFLHFIKHIIGLCGETSHPSLLISGGVFLAMGGALMFLSLVAIEIALFFFIQDTFNITFNSALLIIAISNIAITAQVPSRIKP